MGLFSKSTKIDLLQKTQENLEATQNNTLLLSQLIQQNFSHTSIDLNCQWTDEDKWRAAYALNLCTVSISQIIEYNDVNFMEREYEAILNNLNLEEMPKDESLLQILKQILDVITFFRIQDGDKKLLEKEYQQKMKNAIWNAVPSLSIITTGGNPFSIAISLAAQVGIGYMNYRREKAQITLEQERKEWELQRSAIEQLNGLRRELFDTAWRLADTYDFRDELRITERQISQYNKILLDTDDMRRYERLLYIENKFEAYPPYWYYLGSAANSVFLNPTTPENVRMDFKSFASKHFEYYLKSITNNSLLREDHLAASCALEYFDLLDNSEYEKKLHLLQIVEEYSGNALDVLEICAFSYLKIGEIEQASNIFRMLVNENYNQKINAQILSKIYVYEIITNNSSESAKLYDTLKFRAPDIKLFPLPHPNQCPNNV